MSQATCHVWVANTALVRDEHHSLLNADERARVMALVRPADRARFITAAVLLRLLVAEHTGAAAAAVHVDRRCDRCAAPHGKPRLPGTDLHGSLSHSGYRVTVALTTAGPVGVDIELIQPKDIAGLSRLCLAPTETLCRDEDFFTYWSRKESVVKATGKGLRVPLSAVVVSPADEPPRLLRYPGEPVSASMADLDVGPAYCGAVTVLTDCPLRVVLQDADDLLRAPVRQGSAPVRQGSAPVRQGSGQALPDELDETGDRGQRPQGEILLGDVHAEMLLDGQQ